MLAEMGLREEVKKIQDTYKASGFRTAAKVVTDEMLSKIPVVPATTMGELKKGLEKYDKSGATRIIVAYVPSTEASTEETISFISSW